MLKSLKLDRGMAAILFTALQSALANEMSAFIVLVQHALAMLHKGGILTLYTLIQQSPS